MDEVDLMNERRSEGQQKYERRPSKPEVVPPGGALEAVVGGAIPIPNGGKSSKGGSPFVGSPRRGSLGNGVAGYPSLAHLLRYEVGNSTASLISSDSSKPPPVSLDHHHHHHPHHHGHHHHRKDRYINSK